MARMRLVGTLTGMGQLEVPGQDRAIPVRYTLNLFRGMIDVGGGNEIEGAASTEGWVSVEDKSLLRLIGLMLVLHLSDGRKLDVFLTDTSGRITGSGDFRPAKTD